MTAHSPPFGQADLTNCERELIHLAGSVQPHGALLVLTSPGLRIVQASANSAAVLGTPVAALLERPVAELGGDLAAWLETLGPGPGDEPVAGLCRLGAAAAARRFEATAHRLAVAGGERWIVELEPLDGAPAFDVVDLPAARLGESVVAAVRRVATATTLGTLADTVVAVVRDLTGYDRVMVYRFDPDGHGQVIAEARDPRLEPLLGHHYPASDIPMRARELYLRNRLRVLVDVDYAPAALVPRLDPLAGTELDMSLCHLRSMSPLHLQYLRNMGVTATLVVSLVHDGALWGLIACHHYRPRNLRRPVRAACALLGEVASTRIAAIEHYAHAQVAIQVRRLEQRLVEATSTDGDWRLALLRNPRALLQPLDATGAALCHDGEILTIGEAPSTPELRALLPWLDAQAPAADGAAPFACSSVARANPAFERLTPVASGVLAVRLSATRPDFLLWFRKEQLLSVTWAGDPTKPMIGDDTTQLSPRRSFAAWSEIVRGTARPWTAGEKSMARAFGSALADIVVQVDAVRLLIVEHQREQVRAGVASAAVPVAVADRGGRVLHANDALRALLALPWEAGDPLEAVAEAFDDAAAARDVLRAARDGRPWRGELVLRGADGAPPRSVVVRVEPVPARDGGTLGSILMFGDLTPQHRVAAARNRLEATFGALAFGGGGAAAGDELAQAILANARLATLDIADGDTEPSAATLFDELGASIQRALALSRQVRGG